MTLEQWAYIGEIGAAAAVFASLVYLGIQLRNANREARASTIQSTRDSEVYLSATFAEHAATWDKVITGQPLIDGEEMRRGVLLFNMLMTEAENRYQQFSSGYLDADSWAARRATLARLVHLPMFAIWIETIGALNHTGSFLELLNGLARSASEE